MNITSAHVLLIADDGPSFGLGHVRRLEYLHHVLAPGIQPLARLLSREAHPFRTLTERADAPFWQRVCDAISLAQPRVCVFDLRYSNWELVWNHVVSSIPVSAQLIGIDVPKDWHSRFHHIVHPGVSKFNLVARSPTWHGGPAWVLANRNPPWNPKPEAAIVTVTTGSQAFDLFHQWLGTPLASLAQSGMEVSWVIGKYVKHRIASLNSQGQPFSYVDDSQIIQRFTRSNFVLTRFGVTAFELIARGIPTIILPGWTEGEGAEVLELERAGVALVARAQSDVSQIAVGLAQDFDSQLRLSNSAKNYFKLGNRHPASQLISTLVAAQE